MIQPKNPSYLYEPQEGSPVTGQSAGFFVPAQKFSFDEAEALRDLAISEAERRRLVEASKSPTGLLEAAKLGKAKFLAESRDLSEIHNYNRMIEETTGETAEPNYREIDPLRREKTPHGQAGCKAVFEFREWCDQYRIRTEVAAVTGNQPPEQTERVSKFLSTRGARKIAESCEYMAMKKGGYKTFVTGTFDNETRERIAAGETTIQKEVTRTMDGLQKLYQRGFIADGERVEQHPGEKLAYCWVVEIPKNEQGEENPHIHMMLGWGVKYAHFEAWAARIEGIWGNGYFHLEKIKDTNCAGSYMAKAAGYLSKAQGSDDQGEVTGNRYGISSEARAPDWVVINEAQLHIMGQLIADVYDHLTVAHGEKYRKRKRLNNALEKTPKTEKEEREKIGKALQKVRAEIKAIPVRCNKYQVILDGAGAFMSFTSWAQEPNYKAPVDWLPEKPEGEFYQPGAAPKPRDSHYFRAIRRKFQKLKQQRQAITAEVGAEIVGWIEECKQCAMDLNSWNEYEAAMAD